MSALRLAILDELLDAQVGSASWALDGVEVVWSGTDVGAFRREVPALQPDAIVVDIELLGEDPVVTAERLREATRAQLTLVTYTFAKRSVLNALSTSKCRAVRSPVRLTALRGMLSGLIVRKILGEGAGVAPLDEDLLRRPQPVAKAAAVKPRFTVSQLGRLKEIDSAVECECPANLADVLTQLVSFERYSATCENKNDQDAAMHRLLFEETAKARAIMEAALVKLLEHENIEL